MSKYLIAAKINHSSNKESNGDLTCRNKSSEDFNVHKEMAS